MDVSLQELSTMQDAYSHIAHNTHKSYRSFPKKFVVLNFQAFRRLAVGIDILNVHAHVPVCRIFARNETRMRQGW